VDPDDAASARPEEDQDDVVQHLEDGHLGSILWNFISAEIYG
jgi:hypothetical protein